VIGTWVCPRCGSCGSRNQAHVGAALGDLEQHLASTAPSFGYPPPPCCLRCRSLARSRCWRKDLHRLAGMPDNNDKTVEFMRPVAAITFPAMPEVPERCCRRSALACTHRAVA
jgi:hypothetical protein